MTTKTKTETGADTNLPRCSDCDSDCWDVNDKTLCWLGGYNYDHVNDVMWFTELADGYCPWLMPGVPFPPKP